MIVEPDFINKRITYLNMRHLGDNSRANVKGRDVLLERGY